MNLLEAIKSGKPFRRRDKYPYVYCRGLSEHSVGDLKQIPCFEYPDFPTVHKIILEDILAEDYEVRDEPS